MINWRIEPNERAKASAVIGVDVDKNTSEELRYRIIEASWDQMDAREPTDPDWSLWKYIHESAKAGELDAIRDEAEATERLLPMYSGEREMLEGIRLAAMICDAMTFWEACKEREEEEAEAAQILMSLHDEDDEDLAAELDEAKRYIDLLHATLDYQRKKMAEMAERNPREPACCCKDGKCQHERHARWEICCDGWYPYCTACGEEPKGREMSNYCPNCGAEMREETMYKMDREEGEA